MTSCRSPWLELSQHHQVPRRRNQSRPLHPRHDLSTHIRTPSYTRKRFSKARIVQNLRTRTHGKGNYPCPSRRLQPDCCVFHDATHPWKHCAIEVQTTEPTDCHLASAMLARHSGLRDTPRWPDPSPLRANLSLRARPACPCECQL